MKRLDWDEYFMIQTLLIRARGTCDRAYVGAVLVKDKRVISTGYNGSVSGDDHCNDIGHHLVEGHCVRTIHAEQNALVQCTKYGISTEGATVYVTHFPCLICTKLLIQAGIKKVVYYYDYRVDEYALNLLEKSGIEIVKYEKTITNEEIVEILTSN